MGTVIDSELLAMLVEMEVAVTEILERHYAADEHKEPMRQVLKHYAPFEFQVHTINGYTARFIEEGIEFYPEGN